MTKKERRLEFPGMTRNMFLLVFVLLVSDLVIIGFLGSFLRYWFFGKSEAIILSDLLFFEGIIILALGTFLTGAMLFWGGWRPIFRAPRRRIERLNEREKEWHSGIRMIIVGAILTGLSIAIGVLFP